MSKVLRRILTKFGILKSAQKTTKYHWMPIDTGVFSGLTLYLPVEWGEEVIRGQHEKEFLNVIQNIAPKGGVFYDIGAHYGWFTAAWLQCGGGYIEAFEPFPENRAVLKQMLSINQLDDKVHVNEVALGLKKGYEWMVSYPGDSSRTFIAQEEEIHIVPESATRQQVAVWPLTELVRENKLRKPALLKIDVEGLEADVVAGAADFLAQDKPVVIVEVHSSLNGLRTADQFRKMGYQMQLLGMKGKNKSLPLVMWVHPESPL